jgi:predicted esterase
MSGSTDPSGTGPHQNQPVASAGAPLEDASAVVILMHGRGATARSILDLADELGHSDVAYLAPQAAGNSWYGNSFLAPLDRNEPGLSSALQAVDDVVTRVREVELPLEQTMLLGFSQGACLTLEYAARNARRYGGLVGFSGGLIGPEGTSRDYDGSLDGTSVFLGCSDSDPHIPLERVHETADVFQDLDADVTERIYENMAHTVNDDELKFATRLLETLREGA